MLTLDFTSCLLALLRSCALARLLPQWRHQDTVHAAVSRLTASFSWSSNLRIHTGETLKKRRYKRYTEKTATKIHLKIHFKKIHKDTHTSVISWTALQVLRISKNHEQSYTLEKKSHEIKASHPNVSRSHTWDPRDVFVEKTQLRLRLPDWPDPQRTGSKPQLQIQTSDGEGGVGGAKTCDPCSQKLSKDLQFVWSLLVCFLHRGKNLTKENSISKLHTPCTSHCLGMISTFNSLKSKLNSLVPPKPGFHELLLKLFLNRTFKMF